MEKSQKWLGEGAKGLLGQGGQRPLALVQKRVAPVQSRVFQKRSGDPNPQYFSKSTACRTNGGRTAVQMGGVLQYKWEAYCRVSLSSKLRSQESTAIQMGGVLP